MKKLYCFTVIILSVIAFPFLALAYIDPGTGSYILQIALAALLGGAFTVKLFFGKIKRWFSKKEESTDSPDDPKGSPGCPPTGGNPGEIPDPESTHSGLPRGTPNPDSAQSGLQQETSDTPDDDGKPDV